MFTAPLAPMHAVFNALILRKPLLRAASLCCCTSHALEEMSAPGRGSQWGVVGGS